MTALTKAARNLLAQDTTLTPLLGASEKWDTWIFPDKPYRTLEGTQRCMIVLVQDGGWTAPNPHNTMRFPRLLAEIWADPTRNADDSVSVDDAKDKIEIIAARLDRHFHTVNRDVPPDAPAYLGSPGKSRVWGTAEQIASRTGVTVLSSEKRGEVDFFPVSDGNGTWMGRVMYNVTLP